MLWEVLREGDIWAVVLPGHAACAAHRRSQKAAQRVVDRLNAAAARVDRVWVIEAGAYEQHSAIAVYRTLEAVIADNPPRTRRGKPAGEWRPSKSAYPENSSWDNGIGGDEHLDVTPMDVLEVPKAQEREAA